MRLSTQAIITLANALPQLNTYLKQAKEGDSWRNVHATYEFSPRVRLKIAKNIMRLTAVVDAYSRTRNGLIIQISGGKSIIQQPQDRTDKAAVSEYERQMADLARLDELLLGECHDIDLDTISEDELNLKSNPIPVAVLAAMAPIMEDETWAAPKIRFQTAASPSAEIAPSNAPPKLKQVP